MFPEEAVHALGERAVAPVTVAPAVAVQPGPSLVGAAKKQPEVVGGIDAVGGAGGEVLEKEPRLGRHAVGDGQPVDRGAVAGQRPADMGAVPGIVAVVVVAIGGVVPRELAVARPDHRPGGVAYPGDVVIKSRVPHPDDLPFSMEPLVPDPRVALGVALDHPARGVVEELHLDVLADPGHLFQRGDAGQRTGLHPHPDQVAPHGQGLRPQLPQRPQDLRERGRVSQLELQRHRLARHRLQRHLAQLPVHLVAGVEAAHPLDKRKCQHPLPHPAIHAGEKGELRQVIVQSHPQPFHGLPFPLRDRPVELHQPQADVPFQAGLQRPGNRSVAGAPYNQAVHADLVSYRPLGPAFVPWWDDDGQDREDYDPGKYLVTAHGILQYLLTTPGDDAYCRPKIEAYQVLLAPSFNC